MITGVLGRAHLTSLAFDKQIVFDQNLLAVIRSPFRVKIPWENDCNIASAVVINMAYPSNTTSLLIGIGWENGPSSLPPCAHWCSSHSGSLESIGKHKSTKKKKPHNKKHTQKKSHSKHPLLPQKSPNCLSVVNHFSTTSNPATLTYHFATYFEQPFRLIGRDHFKRRAIPHRWTLRQEVNRWHQVVARIFPWLMNIDAEGSLAG